MTRPWEQAAGLRPWEAQQFIYPRTIAITRPNVPSGFGSQPYQGVSEANEGAVVGIVTSGAFVSGIPASVQLASSGRNNRNELPADSPGPLKWAVYLPGSVMATLPQIMERDVIYDDLGRRFQVAGFEPSTIGAHIDTVRLLN